ncbi:MAG: hypothetical protein U9O64_03915 [Campylobacterota bacterium]|nr:hypothetical protein [Campylobacterota bacterium]
MKNLFLKTVVTLGLGLTAVNANMSAGILDRHLAGIDYDIAGEGVGIGEFTEEKYQEIKADRSPSIATLEKPTDMEVILDNAFKSNRTCEDHYAH